MLESAKCVACGINPVKNSRSIQCESCTVALRKVNQQLATFRHRERAKIGKARKNMTYKGKPTEYAVLKALQILKEADKEMVTPLVDQFVAASPQH